MYTHAHDIVITIHIYIFSFFRYPYDVDKEFVQLKLVTLDDKPIGAINWFAVHGTSMNSTNCLVSSDNIGYASVLFDMHMNNGTPPGQV